MRISLLAAFAAPCLLAFAARADDTRPPAISEVKASVKGASVTVEAKITDETGVLSAVCHHRGKGGEVEDSPMTKSDYDDTFKVSFPGSGDSEYWIDASDLLGNGPSTYGSKSKPYAASSKPGKGFGTAVATREAPPPKEPPEKHAKKHARTASKSSGPPIIEHRKPTIQPPVGQDFTVRVKIKSDAPVGVAILQARPAGTATFTNSNLTHNEGESWEGKIPGSMAKGSVEYFLAAKNSAGQLARLGDGDAKTPFVITFKPSSASGPTASADQAAGPYGFTHNPLYRVPPSRPILIRAQVVPSADDGQMPDRVAVLWRGNDAQDQITEMASDATGGYGGYQAELPAQEEGAVYYQVIACDGGATHCAADTGSKRRWHAAAIGAQPGSAQPTPIDAVSSKAPTALAE